MAPKLYELIYRSADKVGFTDCIDDVILTPSLSVSVYYEPNLSNLIFKSRAKLCIGVGLCQFLSEDELCAVIGHELAHFAQPEAKYKAYLARIINISSRLGKNGVTGQSKESPYAISGLLAIPTRVFCNCFNSIFDALFDANTLEYQEITTEMELQADKVSAEAFGAENLISALCKSSALSDRISIYKRLILPYLSSLGYRCDGYWETFKATGLLFKSIDGLEIDAARQLLGLGGKASEHLLSLRLGALENMTNGSTSDAVGGKAKDAIPQVIIDKMDSFLCGKYDQIQGIIIGYVRYSDIISRLRSGVFAEAHSMSEAFVILDHILTEVSARRVGVEQTILPEYEKPYYMNYPPMTIMQPTELVYTSGIENCPVCGYKVNENTKICPRCREIISE